MTKKDFVLAAALMLSGASAPALAQQVNADWDKSATFANFKTYAWTQGTIPPGANPLMVQRVQSAIEAELSPSAGFIHEPRHGTWADVVAAHARRRRTWTFTRGAMARRGDTADRPDRRHRILVPYVDVIRLDWRGASQGEARPGISACRSRPRGQRQRVR